MKKRKRKRNNKRDAMVFGDNVRARRAARALPRTPPTGETEEEDREKRKTSNETTHPPPFHNPQHNT